MRRGRFNNPANRVAFGSANEEYLIRLRNTEKLVKALENRLERHQREQKRNSESWDYVKDMEAVLNELTGLVAKLPTR